MPSFFRVRTTLDIFDLRISGYVVSARSSWKLFSVYSRKHLPGRVRPARPALCLALALDIGETNSDSTLTLGLKTFCFENPGSTTADGIKTEGKR